jgi:hypothetical protein
MATGTASAARLERLFIRCAYATYSLAAACLLWSEFGLISEIGAIAVAAFLLIVVAFVLEGRWALGGAAANLVGACIIGLAGIWIALQWVRSSESVLNKLPWPTSMVPLVGPVLLLLLIAKLLRPKSMSDHWALQGIALVCVGLGCTLADDAVFAVLMMSYWVSAIWCLGIFFVYRERLRSAGALPPAKLPRPRQFLTWIVPILILALIGFFTVPRSEQVWQVPGKKRTEVGTSEEQSISLNNTGTLELDPEVAFEVYVQDRSGNPKLDLPADQRWRGPLFRYYEQGNWRRTANAARLPGSGGAVSIANVRLPPFDIQLPSLDRLDQFSITFTVKSKLGQIPFLYDPIYFVDGARVPVVGLLPDDTQEYWRSDPDGLVRPQQPLTPGKTRYLQLCVPPPASDLSHAFPLEQINPISTLKDPPRLPGLVEWTNRLLERLVAQGSLDRAVIEDRDVRGEVNAAHYEAIARALENHLARSGEYTYSLTLGRTDPTIDPVEDFLYNTKSGHCNRFTTALAVMLRSLRIPCQVVLGYRGADSRGDGHYDVRQCYAHSWVEVLIPRRGPAPPHGMFAGEETWHWLAVDPTPADAAAEANAVGNRWWSSTFDWRKLFSNLIVNYSADNRDELFMELWMRGKAGIQALIAALTASGEEGFRARIVAALAGLVALALLIVLGQWIRRRAGVRFKSRKATAGIEFHGRLLSILARRGLTPAAGQTPREFAASVGTVLNPRAEGAEMNRVVHATSELYYRVRFGQVALSADERQQVQSRLDWLSAALAKPAD